MHDDPAADPSPEGGPSAREGAVDDVLAVEEITDEDLAAARALRRRRKARKSTTRSIVEWVLVLGGALLLAFLVRTFAFQTFWIPSTSMATTLNENDRVLVNKLSYRFGDPGRGDVIVFERPPGETGEIKDLIKRVVGLPGERVSIMDGSVYIDGRLLREPYTHDLPTDATINCGTGTTTGIDTPTGMLVPEEHVFVLGDNRTGSHDGRCFGPIDQDLIVGRAFMIIWPPSKIGGL